MVERLRANGITDARVLNAMSVVPRHMFVDPGLAAQAYEDAALPIGHHQTISKPSVVARMIELVAAGRTLTKVLEIGTGCGYQAAVLSQVATEVYSIERVRPLSERAKLNLRPLRVPNIRLHYGDGRLGLPAAAPFDAIVIACAGLDVPQALLDQLAIGGRLVAPVGSQSAQSQVLTLVERVSATQWREVAARSCFLCTLEIRSDLTPMSMLRAMRERSANARPTALERGLCVLALSVLAACSTRMDQAPVVDRTGGAAQYRSARRPRRTGRRRPAITA